MITAATSAIQQNLQSFEQAAARIGHPATGVQPGDIAKLQEAELAVKVNAAVIAQSQAIAESIIDILA